MIAGNAAAVRGHVRSAKPAEAGAVAEATRANYRAGPDWTIRAGLSCATVVGAVGGRAHKYTYDSYA